MKGQNKPVMIDIHLNLNCLDTDLFLFDCALSPRRLRDYHLSFRLKSGYYEVHSVKKTLMLQKQEIETFEQPRHSESKEQQNKTIIIS